MEEPEKKLFERNKELKCLYKMADIIEQYDSGLSHILSEIVKIIPPAMQFPELTHAKIHIKNEIYTSTSFIESEIIHQNFIHEGKTQIGTLTVYLESSNLQNYYKIILPEEISLLNSICERVGRVSQRISFSEELERTRHELEIRNTLLERKNIALAEVLNHLNSEMEKKDEEIMSSINNIILPLIDKMKNQPNPDHYFDILTNAIKDITSPFNKKLISNFTKLTQKEIEICNLLKNGKSSKEIGALLSLSTQTINKHRDNIRRKFGIKNQKINLVTFLNNFDDN